MDAFASHRVLVVDDNKDIANSVAALLRLLGHTVLPTYDGATAIALAGDFKPDIAFLDIMMPEMDGFEVARQLREQPALKGLKIVALTALDEATILQKQGYPGFAAHLIKPTSAQDLMDTLAF
jgi:CheY-like chemotaxis protein